MSIGKYLDKIRNAVYGREVRESIAKGIETAYNDAAEKHDNANMEVKLARGTHSNLNNRLKKMDEVDEQTTAQLAQTATIEEVHLKRNKSDLVDLEEVTPRFLQAISDSPGTPINVLSTPRPNSVKVETFSKSITSINLFDKDTTHVGYYVDNNTGELIGSSSRNTSDFIYIEQPVNSIVNVKQYAFYDGEFNFISGVNLDGQGENNHQFTSPETAKYIRFSWYSTLLSLDDQMFIKGDGIPENYVPYYFKLKDIIVEDSNLEENLRSRIEGSELIGKRMENTLNLFDKNKITLGKYIRAFDGAILDSTSSNTSDYIPVTPSETYTVTSVRTYALYDINKNFISGHSSLDNNVTFEVTSNTRYIRLSYYTNSVDDGAQMLVEGDKLPEKYVPFGYSQPDLIINESNFAGGIEGSFGDNKDEKYHIPTNWQDITVVDDEVWAFGGSDGAPDGFGGMYMYKGETRLKRLFHNFGHCNTIEYQEKTDSLIFGNGTGYYETDGKIHIIQGVKHWRSFESDYQLDMEMGIEGSVITHIDVGRDFGDKVNVCWGEDNGEQHNIAYVISNDAQNFRKILLGKGANDLGKGQFVSERTDSEFNGTYKVLGEWETSRIDVVQGGCYYNGSLYIGIGHDGLWVVKYNLYDDGSLDIEHKKEKHYNPDGTINNSASEGVTVRNGVMYHAVKGGSNILYKMRAF